MAKVDWSKGRKRIEGLKVDRQHVASKRPRHAAPRD
jgi:hypothetical protein